MDDVKLPPPGDDEVVELKTPEKSNGALAIPQLGALTIVQQAEESEVDGDGLMDFEIGPQVVPGHRVEMGPGSKGRMVPYFSYGLFAVMSPQSALVDPSGKRPAILVPLPPSGSISMTNLKKLANKLWREARQPKMDD